MENSIHKKLRLAVRPLFLQQTYHSVMGRIIFNELPRSKLRGIEGCNLYI